MNERHAAADDYGGHRQPAGHPAIYAAAHLRHLASGKSSRILTLRQRSRYKTRLPIRMGKRVLFCRPARSSTTHEPARRRTARKVRRSAILGRHATGMQTGWVEETRCDDVAAHATKGLRNADTGELAAIRDAAMALIEHERLISPRVLTDLYLIREEAIAELRNRRPAGSRRLIGKLSDPGMPRRPAIFRRQHATNRHSSVHASAGGLRELAIAESSREVRSANGPGLSGLPHGSARPAGETRYA